MTIYSLKNCCFYLQKLEEEEEEENVKLNYSMKNLHKKMAVIDACIANACVYTFPNAIYKKKKKT